MGAVLDWGLGLPWHSLRPRPAGVAHHAARAVRTTASQGFRIESALGALMRIENEFVVKAPLERVWNYVVDVERLAPCAPGAELTEVVDERTWKGRLNMKVGPISMSFAGTVVIEGRDEGGHRDRTLHQRRGGPVRTRNDRRHLAADDGRVCEMPGGEHHGLKRDRAPTSRADWSRSCRAGERLAPRGLGLLEGRGALLQAAVRRAPGLD